METAPAPRPKEYNPNDRSNADLPPQDPWAGSEAHHAPEQYQIPTDGSEDLKPLPGISPQQEAAKFDQLAQTFVRTELIEPKNGSRQPTQDTSQQDTEPYTPRHLRLNDDTPFVPNPISDLERRNAESFKATAKLAESLQATNPELKQGIDNYLNNVPLENPDKNATEQTPQPEQTTPPETYAGRHRKLGRIARWFAKLRS